MLPNALFPQRSFLPTVMTTMGLLALTLNAITPCSTFGQTSEDSVAIFDQAMQVVEDHFYDPDRLDTDFQSQRKAIRRRLANADDPLSLAQAVNLVLETLQTSHTYYLTPDEVEYYRIASVFQTLPVIAEHFPESGPTHPSLGFLPVAIDDQWYVQSVLPGTEAEASGLQIGDQIVAINDAAYHPISVLTDKVDTQVQVQFLRNGQPSVLPLTVRSVDPQTEFLDALKASISVRDIDGVKVGYAHFYSFAGKQFQETLVESIRWGELAKADVLVMDLRYGMGGADLSYLNLFQTNLPTMTMVDRTGKVIPLDGQWRKPAVYIIDGSARSGKETLAYGAQKLGFATLVGTPTAGAVVGGSPFLMSNGDLLYLAVRDVLIDGNRLEGNPVTPDHVVELDLKSCAGVDAQVQAAFRHAVDLVTRSQKTSEKAP